MSNLYALVMAGGKGTRFWPESTSSKPKQYLRLLGKESLLQQSLTRFENKVPNSHRFIVTVKDQEKLAREQAKGFVGEEAFIFEPAGRNTAPCILLSLAYLREKGAQDDDVVAVVPSDHVILNINGFQDSLDKAVSLASDKGHIVTIGITPASPHTGYGYIECGDGYNDYSFAVTSFKEKPDRETAQKYLDAGNYVWNAGMFVGQMKTLEGEFANCSPEVFEHYSSLKNSLNDEKKLEEAYNQVREDSFDYAVMEKSKKISVVKAGFDWNDLGSWDALESVIEKEDGNTIASAEGSQFLDSSGNIIFTPGKHVSLIGIDDLIVVSNERNVLIARKDRSQDVKKIVEFLKKSGDPQGLT